MTGWSPETGCDLEQATDRLRQGDLSSRGPAALELQSDLPGRGGPEPDRPDEESPLFAVYKPGRGERSLWDFPDGLYRREVAAYRLSELLGWGLVPPTLLRDDGPFGPGSLQLFVEADYEQHYFTLFDAGGHEDALRTICLFDAVANNADRKSGHVLIGPDGRLWAIDHGLCFHPQPKLRTVIWDFAGDGCPATCSTDLDRLCDLGPDEFAGLLTGAEVHAVAGRARSLLTAGVFPEPWRGPAALSLAARLSDRARGRRLS